MQLVSDATEFNKRLDPNLDNSVFGGHVFTNIQKNPSPARGILNNLAPAYGQQQMLHQRFNNLVGD